MSRLLADSHWRHLLAVQRRFLACARSTMWFCLFCCGLSFSSHAQSVKTYPSALTAFAKQEGLQLKKALSTPQTAGEQKRWLAVFEKDGALTLRSFRKTGSVFKVDAERLPLRGNELKKMQLLDMVSTIPGPELILEVYGENPDEKIKRLVILALEPTFRELFTKAIYRPKNAKERNAWENAKTLIKYGTPFPGWYFSDEEFEGATNMEVRMRDTPQILKVPLADREPAHLVTGIREHRYQYQGDAASGRFEKNEESEFVEYLPRQTPSKIFASAAFAPPKVLKKLEAEKLAASLADATDGKKVDSDSDKIDFAPFIDGVSDNNLATHWIENDASGSGYGEWVELFFKKPVPVKMIRIVPGCVDNKKSYRQHNVPGKIELRFSDSTRAFVNLDSPQRPRDPVVAMMHVPIKDKPFAKQVLIFFAGDREVEKIRLTLNDVKKQGKKDRTCLTEFNVH